MPDPVEREERAGRLLEQAARDSETLGTSSLARGARRAGDHFAGRDAIGVTEDGRTDPVEIWGRRVGRALSVPFALVLIWWLGVQLGWWAAP
jgi:hypothetical protein